MLRSTLWLTLSGIIAKTVDFVFRAYYTKILGGEGMGIFSLAISIHSVMINISSGGMGVAVSKLVSENYAACGGRNIKKIMKIALATVMVISFAVVFTVFIFSEQIAENFLKEPRCRRSIIFLSPSILFMGLSYCIKGYFYASRKVLRPASSEFLEQFVKIVVITTLIRMWLPGGTQYGCEAVALGLSVGEAASCLYLLLLYKADSRKLTEKAENELHIGREIAKISMPVMCASLASSFLRTQESVLIVSGLEKSGLSHNKALSAYGTVYGMAIPLIVFPLTLLSSFFTLLVPEISRAKNMKSPVRLGTLVSRIYRFAFLSGFFVMCVYLVFAGELAEIVYNAPKITQTLRFLAILSPLMVVDSVSCGILNGIGRQGALLKYSMLDSALRIGMIVFLIPQMGIKALLLVVGASNVFTFLMTTRRSAKESGVCTKIKSFMAPCVAALICYFVVHNIFNALSVDKTAVSLGCGILFSIMVYMSAASVCGAISGEDSKWLVSRLISNR